MKHKSNYKRKVKSLSEISAVTQRLRRKGKRIVHCHGVFDLVHPGHIRHLNAAKEAGDILVVSITADRHVKRGPGRPFFPTELRAEQLAELETVDFVVPVNHPTAVEAITAIRPNFYVKGQDYKNRKDDVTGKIYDEEAALREAGGKIHFTEEVTYSSSKLLNNAFDAYPPQVLKFLKSFSKKFSANDVLEKIQSAKNLRVLVIGDAIIDQYAYCVPMAKSSKEPIVVNKYLSEEAFAGGALATANHTAQVCNRVELATVLGVKNSYEELIKRKLHKSIKRHFLFRKGAGTTIKKRFVSHENNQKFFEVCYMDDSLLNGTDERKLLTFLKDKIKTFDLVIANDFGHGMLTPKAIQILSSKAKKLALNVQTNSANIGFNMVTKYRRADFVCIDEVEMRLALHDKTGDLKGLVRKIAKSLKAKMVVVTRGKDGSITYSEKSGFCETPAFSFRVIDKVGAGDAYFAFAAPCFAAGMPPDMTAFVGNVVGSLAVQIVGNRNPVQYGDLAKFITRLLKF